LALDVALFAEVLAPPAEAALALGTALPETEFAAVEPCAPLVAAAAPCVLLLAGDALMALLAVDVAPGAPFAVVDDEVTAVVAAFAAALIARTDAGDVVGGVTLIARTELVEPELVEPIAMGFAAAAGCGAGAGGGETTGAETTGGSTSNARTSISAGGAAAGFAAGI
jgi:hypothetical protein